VYTLTEKIKNFNNYLQFTVQFNGYTECSCAILGVGAEFSVALGTFSSQVKVMANIHLANRFSMET
jgi:hypothetical protein